MSNTVDKQLKWNNKNQNANATWNYLLSSLHWHRGSELFWLFQHYHALEDQTRAVDQQTAMGLPDRLCFSQELPVVREIKGISTYYLLEASHKRSDARTCLATASDLSPRSANLSIVAWTFLLTSSLQPQRARICAQANIWYHALAHSFWKPCFIMTGVTCSGAPLLARCQFPLASM